VSSVTEHNPAMLALADQRHAEAAAAVAEFVDAVAGDLARGSSTAEAFGTMAFAAQLCGEVGKTPPWCLAGAAIVRLAQAKLSASDASAVA
jgi:hypothetical protein